MKLQGILLDLGRPYLYWPGLILKFEDGSTTNYFSTADYTYRQAVKHMTDSVHKLAPDDSYIDIYRQITRLFSGYRLIQREIKRMAR